MLASAQFSNHENMQSLNAEKKGGFHSLLRNYPVPTLTLDKSLTVFKRGLRKPMTTYTND